MAYVRWSRPGFPHAYDSIVYVYADVSGGITCCTCTLLDGDSFNCDTAAEMVNHLQLHRQRGDPFPDWVIPSIKSDAQFIDGCRTRNGLPLPPEPGEV